MTNTHARGLTLLRLGSARALTQALMIGVMQEPFNMSSYYAA